MNGFEEYLTISDKISVQFDLTFVIKYAEIHFFGVKVDSAIKLVLFGVKSHMASSFKLKWFMVRTTVSYFLEEAFNSINAINSD